LPRITRTSDVDHCALRQLFACSACCFFGRADAAA